MTALTPQRSDSRSDHGEVGARLRQLQRRYPLLQIIALAIALIYGLTTLPGLASWGGIKTILVVASIIGVVSIGQTVVVLLGGFDLSLPGFMVASAYFVTNFKQQDHLPFVVALAIAVLACGVLGALSGYVCHRFDVQPLIVTLGMGSALAGFVQAVSGDGPVGQAPQWTVHLTSIGTRTVGLDIPPVVLIWLGATLALAYLFHRTVTGRRLMATGANRASAEHALINTRRVWMGAFAMSGIMAVFAGLLVAGFAGNLDTTTANPYLFQSLVAVIVGGTVFGGPGDYTRTVVGALFLAVLNTVLVGHGAAAQDQDILYGVVLVVAVASYGRERRLRDRI
jgi:ribose transport system permease protein